MPFLQEILRGGRELLGNKREVKHNMSQNLYFTSRYLEKNGKLCYTFFE